MVQRKWNCAFFILQLMPSLNWPDHSWPLGADQHDRINADLLQLGCQCIAQGHLNASRWERGAYNSFTPHSHSISTGNLLATRSPDTLTKCTHVRAQTNACVRKTIQAKCGMSTKPSSSLCVWKLAKLPPSIKLQRDRESVQLFIFFHPLPPQETLLLMEHSKG